jgi:hypothetical protein
VSHVVTIVLVFAVSMSVVFSLGFVAGAAWASLFAGQSGMAEEEGENHDRTDRSCCAGDP